ncbi:hypothetical protein [Tropicimonas aquimaris]|uniref:Uncharacterized protein n=1 Tax=Tropicimonas aquimaris TaxID=914152 RepID=A0ABW3IMI5_9RHOB
MSIKRRLERAEREAGVGLEPEVIIFTTYFQQRDGSSIEGHFMALITMGGKQVDGVYSEDGETFAATEARLDRRIKKLTGGSDTTSRG